MTTIELEERGIVLNIDSLIELLTEFAQPYYYYPTTIDLISRKRFEKYVNVELTVTGTNDLYRNMNTYIDIKDDNTAIVELYDFLWGKIEVQTKVVDGITYFDTILSADIRNERRR